MAVMLNLLLAYVVYFLARMAFYAENYQLYGQIGWGHFMELLRGGLAFDTSAILYTNLLWVVMVLLPLPQKENGAYHSACRAVFVFINTLTLVLNLCDAVYFRYTLRRTTTTVFSEFSHENNLAGIVFEEVLNHFYLIILAVAVAWLLWRFYVTPPLRRDSLRWQWYVPAMLLSMAAFTPFFIAGVRGGWTRAVRPITLSNANDYCDRPTETGLVLNTPFALIRTIGKNLFEVPDYFPSLEACEKVYTPIHLPQSESNPAHSEDNPILSDGTLPLKGDALSQKEGKLSQKGGKLSQKGDKLSQKEGMLPQRGGRSRKKNVVVFIVESFGREYIGALNRHLDGGTYRGYTPFTDSLLQHALTFSHTYCNGRKSIDGMPSILSGIPMFVEPFFLSPYSVNDVSGLADCLNRKGYETAFFHGADRGSMGFMSFARATKFKNYYGREDFVADPRTRGDKDFNGFWGISDVPFLQYFCQKLSEMQQPFMTALFTLSSHHPFVVPDEYKEQFKEEGLPIHKVIRYTDHALRLFFDAARRQPWFDNTVFVITSDHTNMNDHDEYLTDLGGFASPVIFYEPSGEIGVGERDAIAQQTDIMPTILNYLGYDEPYLSFGVDLLSTPPEETWAVNYMNGIYQYVKYGHVMQFDGEKTRAVYSLDDRLMHDNVVGRFDRQQQMEQELKAIIYQYMVRMTSNNLVPDKH